MSLYDMNPLDDEEERKKREAIAERMDAEAYGNPVGPVNPSFMDTAGQYLNNRIGAAQNRIAQAGNAIMNPQQALQQRMMNEQRQEQQDEAANTEVQTQTTKSYADGSQERTVKTQVPAEQAQGGARLTTPIPGMPQNLPAQGSISPEQANAPVAMAKLPQAGPQVQVAGATQMPAQAAQAAPQFQRPTGAMPPVNYGLAPEQGQAPVRMPQMAPQTGQVAAAPGASLAQMGANAQAQATPYTPTAERITEPMSAENIQQQAVIDAKNTQDAEKRRMAYAKLIASPDVDEGTKALANRFIADDYIKQREIQKANDDIQKASPTDLARYIKEEKKEGSYVKAILLQRLGLTSLAEKEMERIDPTINMSSASDAEGNKYTVGRDKLGNVTVGFDASGKQVGQETLAKLSAAALPTKAHLLPSAHGSPVVNDKGEVGLIMLDPQTNTSYVQVGKERRSTAGWTTMSQNVQNTFGAAQAGAAGKVAGETGMAASPLQPFPGSTVKPSSDPAVVDSARRDLASLQKEIDRIPANDPKRDERLAILNSEVAKAQGTIGSGAPQVNQPFWKQKQDAAIQEAQRKSDINVSEAAKTERVKENAKTIDAKLEQLVSTQYVADKGIKALENGEHLFGGGTNQIEYFRQSSIPLQERTANFNNTQEILKLAATDNLSKLSQFIKPLSNSDLAYIEKYNINERTSPAEVRKWLDHYYRAASAAYQRQADLYNNPQAPAGRAPAPLSPSGGTASQIPGQNTTKKPTVSNW